MSFCPTGTEEKPSSFLLRAQSFRGLVRGNRTLGDVADLLKDDTTEQDIITAMRAKYDAPAGVIERDVRKALDIFREIGALDEH